MAKRRLTSLSLSANDILLTSAAKSDLFPPYVLFPVYLVSTSSLLGVSYPTSWQSLINVARETFDARISRRMTTFGVKWGNKV